MCLDRSSAIGLFDSGVGGLTVAHAIQNTLPLERMIYFGDTFHLPYGDKSVESVRYYSERIASFLLSEQCKVILIACNTASANAYHLVRDFVGDKALVMNVIDPVVHHVVENHKHDVVGVIGTKGTIQSNSYAERIRSLSPQTPVRSLATPLLVPMIEEGFLNDEISDAILKAYLDRVSLADIHTLILGCTHYPIVREQIAAYYKGRVRVLDTASIVANHLKQQLQSNNLLAQKNDAATAHRFFVSDYTENFRHIAEFFFHQQVDLQLLNLWK